MMRRLKKLGLFALLGLCAAPAFAVVDGVQIRYPHNAQDRLMKQVTVRLVVMTSKGFETFCSGVQVGQNKIYSAGHCFLNSDMPKYALEGRVFVEAYDPATNGGWRRVRVKRYAGSLDPDFAMVEVERDLPAQHSLPTAAVAACDQGSVFSSVGFGITEESDNTDTLRRANYVMTDQNIRLVPKSDDKKKPSKQKKAQTKKTERPTFVALGAANHAKVCMGDSGGPVFCRVKGRLALVGISRAITGDHESVRKISVSSMPRHMCRYADSLLITPVQDMTDLVGIWEQESDVLDQMTTQTVEDLPTSAQ